MVKYIRIDPSHPSFDGVWTHGGLKYCSSATYMPRNISVMRKNRPARSSVDSDSSSHRFDLGNRKPDGGGPDGVA